ncbi:MAG: rod shape-determining protein MreC [Candidatus Tectomicrobia bacterium]|uniref:Cell shape-determining protein MreC n=1 Tax=Tectimicrobiota bacterium TaxID=2528274 RepID=A0A932MN16_UNCTE|nr:rod shape-determining protein MreC [Candidatus Tectomicrobia bacterium]
MFQLIHERRSATLLTALFLVCFTLMTLSVRRQGGVNLIERGILSLTGPLLEAAAAPKRWTRDLGRQYLLFRDLREENIVLKKQLSAMRGVSFQLRELEAKVQRLEGFLTASRGLPAPVRLAHILGRDVSPFGQTLLVDLGTAHGVRRGMPVVNPSGVVGRISRAGHTTSRVLLLTDSRSAVDVIVQRTRAQGIFSMGPADKGEVRYLATDSDVQEGDLLIASGLGGVFPKGLPVAWVTKVGPKGERLFRHVEARSAVNFNSLEEVLIMMTPAQENGRP